MKESYEEILAENEKLHRSLSEAQDLLQAISGERLMPWSYPDRKESRFLHLKVQIALTVSSSRA